MNEPIKVEIELVHEDSHPLHRSTEHAAGYDIYSVVNEEISPLGWKVIPTGIKIKSMPPWMEGQVRTRSGMASKYGVFVMNSPGTIDPDYRGEIQVILMNMGHMPYDIYKGDRIAQVVFNKHVSPELNAVVINHKVRGEHGLGSTGRGEDTTVGARW